MCVCAIFGFGNLFLSSLEKYCNTSFQLPGLLKDAHCHPVHCHSLAISMIMFHLGLFCFICLFECCDLAILGRESYDAKLTYYIFSLVALSTDFLSPSVVASLIISRVYLSLGRSKCRICCSN